MKFETDEITNPKKTLARREAMAEGEPLKKEIAEPGHKGARFGKQWSNEDRAKHQKALASVLRNRR